MVFHDLDVIFQMKKINVCYGKINYYTMYTRCIHEAGSQLKMIIGQQGNYAVTSYLSYN